MSRFAGTVSVEQSCSGAGLLVKEIVYGTAICPECNSIARVDTDSDTIEAHIIYII